MSLVSQLTEQVRIEYPAVSDDGYGGKTVAWTELATVWAQVTPVYNAITENVLADQLQSTAGYRVVIRLRTDVTAAMRLVWKTHTLTVHSLHETNATLSILSYEENL